MVKKVAYCQICHCQKTSHGWQKKGRRVPKDRIYNTICKNCLASWTDDLISEAKGTKVA